MKLLINGATYMIYRYDSQEEMEQHISSMESTNKYHCCGAYKQSQFHKYPQATFDKVEEPK